MPSATELNGRSQQQQQLNQVPHVNSNSILRNATLDNGNISDGGEESGDENSYSSQQDPNVTLNNNNNNLFNNIIMGEQLGTGQTVNMTNNTAGVELLEKRTVNGSPRTMSTGGVPLAILTNRPNSHAFQERRIPLYPNQQAKVRMINLLMTTHCANIL